MLFASIGIHIAEAGQVASRRRTNPMQHRLTEVLPPTPLLLLGSCFPIPDRAGLICTTTMQPNTMQRVAVTAAMLVLAFGTENVEAQLCCTGIVLSDCMWSGWCPSGYESSVSGGGPSFICDPCCFGTVLVLDQMDLLELHLVPSYYCSRRLRLLVYFSGCDTTYWIPHMKNTLLELLLA
jgi:hypothetical protein